MPFARGKAVACGQSLALRPYTVHPGLVSCPFYTIPIYTLSEILIYFSFIFILLLAVTVIECNNNSLFFTSIILIILR